MITYCDKFIQDSLIPEFRMQGQPFQSWLYMVTFIHYKPRIAVAILDL